MRNPLVAGSLVVGSFAEDHLGMIVHVYYHREVIAVGQAVTIRVQIGVAGNKAGNLHDSAKVFAAIGALAEE